MKPNDDVVMSEFSPSGVISWMIDKEMYDPMDNIIVILRINYKLILFLYFSQLK